MDPLETVSLDGSDRCIYISTLLSNEEKAQLCQVLQVNVDVFAYANVFAWTHADMPGINPVHASHKLNVAPFAKLIRQKVRRFHHDRHLVIQTEVDNLLHNGFIRTVKGRVAGQRSCGSKKGEQMKSMCGLHRPQRHLSQR